MTFNTYPFIQFNNTNTEEGIFTKKVLLIKSFATNHNNQIFVANKTSKLRSFISMDRQKHNGYLVEILFHGFNFTAKRFKLYRSKYYIDTHKSELFICEEKAASTFKSQIHKRRLIFFSYDRMLLHKIAKTIKEFKIPDSYTGKGFFTRDDSYKIKHRKKRR